MNFNELIETRKSTRGYDATICVSSADVNQILLAGAMAPVGRGAFDSLHLTVVQGELLSEIRAFVAKENGNPDANPFFDATTLIFVSTNIDSPLGYANVGCVMTSMCYQATELGLANLYLAGFVSVLAKYPEWNEKLGISTGFKPLAALAVGYSDGANDKRVATQRITVNYAE